jgi:hypothetical protein
MDPSFYFSGLDSIECTERLENHHLNTNIKEDGHNLDTSIENSSHLSGNHDEEKKDSKNLLQNSFKYNDQDYKSKNDNEVKSEILSKEDELRRQENEE